MAAGSPDVKQLLLQVDASVALAQRNLSQLAAQVQRDSQRMDTSLATVDSATTRLGAGFTKLNGVLGSFGVALGVGAIANASRSILTFADDLDAASEQAGMSVERYQTLREALRTLEIPTQAVDRIFRQLQTTLGDVQNGVDSGATQSLDRLGIKARILNGEIETSDQLLDALAGSARNAGTAAQFASEVTDIFGARVGPQLATALRDGGDALHELEQAMRQTGLVIDEEMVQTVAEANETLDHFFEMAKSGATLFAAHMIESFGEAKNAVLGYLESLAGNNQILGTALLPFLQTRSPADSLAGQNSRIGTSRSVMTLQQVGQAGGGRRPPRPARTSGGGGGGGGRSRGGGGGRARVTATPRPGDLDDQGLILSLLLGPAAGASPEMVALLERASMTSEEWAAHLEEARVATTGMMEALAEPLPEAVITSAEQERLLDFARTFQRDLAGGLAEAVMYGGDLGDVLEETFLRAGAAALESGIFELIGMLAGAVGGGGGGGFLSAFTSIFGGGQSVPGIGGGKFGKGAGPKFGGFKAGGGPVSPGSWYMVGEKGPEPFVPKVPGVIIPNRAAFGGGGVTQHIYMKGNMVSSEYIAAVQQMGVVASQRGAQGGMAGVFRRSARTFP